MSIYCIQFLLGMNRPLLALQQGPSLSAALLSLRSRSPVLSCKTFVFPRRALSPASLRLLTLSFSPPRFFSEPLINVKQGDNKAITQMSDKT